jgi:hypothetical protein
MNFTGTYTYDARRAAISTSSRYNGKGASSTLPEEWTGLGEGSESSSYVAGT